MRERDSWKGNNPVATMMFMVLPWHEKRALCAAFEVKFSREGGEGCKSQVASHS